MFESVLGTELQCKYDIPVSTRISIKMLKYVQNYTLLLSGL